MENLLNYTLLLPLQELSLRRLIILLWKQIDGSESGIIYSCSHYSDTDDSEDSDNSDSDDSDSDDSDSFFTSVEKIEPLIESKLEKLKLPTLLFKKASSLIAPIISEIKKWKLFHEALFEYFCDYSTKTFDKKIFDNLSWTSLGTINYSKTAKNLICAEMLDSFVLFKLACFYCLEDCIPVLFQKLPEIMKQSLRRETIIYQTGESYLNAFWHNILHDEDNGRERELENPTNFYQYVFEISAHLGNDIATKYFYKKLAEEERAVLLFKTAQEIAEDDFDTIVPQNNLSDVLFYLLSQMIPEQQIELFKEHPFHVLKSFLNWPWQDLFIDAVELAWDFLPVDDYFKILSRLSVKDNKLGKLNVDLFHKLFSKSTSYLKNSFVDRECQDQHILLNFFSANDSESIKFIFANIDTASKLRLAFSDQGFQICRLLVREKQSSLLRLFFQEAMLSEDDRVRLKDGWMLRFASNNENDSDSKIPESEQFLLLFNQTKDIAGRK